MAKKRNYQEIKSRIKSDPSYKDYKPEKTHYEELKDRIHNGELYYGTDENFMDSYNKALEEYQSNLSAGNKQYNYKEKRKQLDAKTSMLAASARSKNATDQGKAAFNDYLKTYTNLMSEGSAYRNAYEKYLQSEQDKKDNASLSRMYKTALSDRLSQGLPVDDVLQGYNRATVDRDSAKEYMANYEAQNPQYSEAALQNYLRMQQNKERTDAMSLDELRENAQREKNSGLSEGTYNQMIQERYALGQSADDLIAERDKAAKNAQDRVLYYDDNDNAVTYDRLYREKVAENTWTNLTSDTEAYKLYEKIKEEEPTTMAMARSGAEAGNDMATLLADKQTLSQMGYNYDEIAYYEKYKADKEGYKESIKEAQNATPLKAAVFSIASAPLQSLEYADNAFYSMMSLGSDDSAYGLANIYDDKYRNKASVMLQGATKMINDYLLDATGSELVAWLGSGAYSGTVSSLQSMAQVAVCKLLFPVGGEAISLGLMASNAANQQFAESIKSGATNAEALAMSIGAGVNEALFEKLSIENLDALDEIINSQRWNYNSFEAFLKSIAQNSPSMLVQGLVEGSEEFFTDIANAIWDQHVNGSNAEYQRTIKEYMDMGYERSVASKMATQKFIADLASSFYGGFIGGLSSSGTHVIGGATGIGLHNTLGASMLGSEISKNNNVDVLLGQANELGDASVSERAAKVSQSENPSKRQIGRLAQEVYSKTADNIIQGHSKAFATEVESKLQDLDETERKQAVDVVSKYQRGEFLSSKERKLFAKVGGTDLIESITSDEEAMERIRTSVEEDEEITKNQERLAETELLTRKDVKELRSFEGSKTKEAIDKAKEKAISIEDEQEAKEETAKDFMRRMGYRQSTMNAVLAEVQRTGKDIGSFLLGVNEAINFGKIGYDQKYIKKNSYYGMLSQSQQNYAYQLGVDARAEGLAEEQARRDRRLGDLAKRTGKVHLMESADKAITELSKSTDKEDQERFASVIKARDVLSFITQNITHGNIYLFASEKNADGKYVVPEDLAEVFKGRENIIAGEIAKQNGIYDSATGDIYIDVNAGTGYEGVILMTAAHELTHFIRDWSPVKFRILGDFLIEQYQKANVPLNTLMQHRVAKGGSFDKEYEELVADSMERMLTDTNVYDKILALKAKDNDIFLKLKAGLEQIVESIKKAYRQFEGNQTMEGYFATTIDNLDKLQDLFAEALVDAGDVYSRATEMDDSEAFLDSKTAVLNQIRTPYTEGTNDWKNFVDGLNPEAKKVHDLFYNFYTLSKLNNVRNRKGNIVKKLNISSVFMTAQDWNEQIKKDSKWGDCAKKLAESLPPKIRERMHMNLDGSLNYDPLETEFKMAKSLAQRLVDALGYETIDNVYDLDGHKITLTTSGAVQSVGGEAYRRAVIAETRKLYKEGKLRQVNMDRMSKDLWGSLGFLAVNTKTGASGDFTTICPQMMFNRGCYYCYRRAALTTGVNNKLVAESVWYTGEILRIKQKDIEALNEDGGLRIQSFGDWMPHFSAQLADVIYDAELRGLQVKIITKEPSMIEYVAKLREQGLGKNLYFNLSADYAIEKAPERFTANTNKDSLDAINSSRPYMRNDDGMWWKRAMTVEEAYEYHKKYPWVNVRIVATTEDEFIRGLKDPRVYVVTGYHGNIREWERIDSTTGEKKLIVEPLGDAGMPWFIANEDGTWSIDPDRMGKNKNQKALGQRILNEGLVDLYYKKTCCIFGRCDQCKGKCGQAANTFYAKNALNDDQDSVAYWADNMTSERIRKNKKAGKEAWALYNESTDAESMLDWYHKTYGKPQAKFSFRGENAQNLTDADRKNLDQAKKMLEKGTSMEEIFRKTGWFTQSDGKWRNEISNKNDRLDVNGLNSVALERYDKRIKDANKAYEDGRIDKETYDDLVETAKKYLEEGSKSGKLDSFLDAPELFAAYPQLRKVSLFFEELPNKTIAQADLDKNSITIDLDRAFMNDEDVRETLLHEVQHFIQEYEGFSSGSNLRSGKYWTAGGEIEARDVEARTKMDEDQRRETMPAKFSTRDSAGKELTLEQQRYFKDSKIRDEEGNLVRVYHGTDANFTVFDRSKGRSTMDIQGSFFSPWEIDAEGYGVNVGAYYLNITNPAPEGIAYKALNRFKGQNDAGVKAREYLESLGYDGVNNSDEEYIAFYPNQVKNIDNLNPTTNEDIRYSERSASEHTMTAQEIIANISDLNSSDYKELFEQLLPDEEYDYYDVYDMGDAYKASMLVELLEGVDPDRTFRVWRGTSSENIKDIERFRFSERVKQGISSADTSLDQIPALFTDKRVKLGKTNIDIGGGRFDRATNYLAEKGTTNYVFDPFNRSASVNRKALDVVMNGGADTATCANVLNVIAEKEARENVILEVAKSIKPDGTAYFMVYEGDGSGIGRETSKGYQNNRKTADYVDEISEYFDNVERHGKLIVATQPKANLPKAAWQLDNSEDPKVVRFSTREYWNDDSYRAFKGHPLMEALKKAIESEKSADSWNKDVIRNLYRDNPKYNYIERLQAGVGEDPDVYRELDGLLDFIDNQDILDDMKWYLVQAPASDLVAAENEDGAMEFVSWMQKNANGIRRFNNMLNARAEEIAAKRRASQKPKETTPDIAEDTRPTLQELRAMFDSLNNNKDLDDLANKVFPLVEKLNIAVVFTKKAATRSKDSIRAGFYRGQKSKTTGKNGLVAYNVQYFNNPNWSNADKAQTILHELIHACTVYTQEYSWGVIPNSELSKLKTDAKVLYMEVKRLAGRHTALTYEYGMKNEMEFLAELSNASFREKLAALSAMVTGDVDGQISFDFNTKEREALMILDKFITLFDENLYEGFTSRAQYRVTKTEDAILYSERDLDAQKQLRKLNDQLESEVKQLKEDYADVKKLLKLQGTVTGGKLVKKSSVEAVARRLYKNLDLDGDIKDFTNLLMDAYGFIQGADELSWEEVEEKIGLATDWAIDHKKERKMPLSPEAKALLKTIRETRVSLSDKMKADAAHRYGSYNNFRKAMMGSITIANDAPQTLDQFWQEMSSMHPEIFDPNVSEADMPLLLADAIASIREIGAEDYYIGQSMMTDQDFFNEIYNGFWDVATLTTVADKKQSEINALKRTHAERMAKLRQTKNEAISQIKKDSAETMARIKTEYRERLQKQKADLTQQFRARTEKARERRSATELRHRITKRVNELSKLLLSPDSKHHVPKNLRPLVAEALDALDLTNPRQGERTRARLNALKDMYKKIANTSEPTLQYAYDEDIMQMIENISEDIGDTPFQKMSVEQLTDLYHMYSAVMATVRNANKTFAWMRNRDVTELAEDVMSEVKTVGGVKETQAKWKEFIKKSFYWDNMKPVYAMRAIGSKTLMKLFDNVRRGEDTFANDITEAKDFFLTQANKYGYDTWDLDERFEFKTADGKSFSLNVEEMMSLYEYYKRPHADAHLRQGGFVFEDSTIKKKNALGIPIEYKVNKADTHRVNPQMMAEIAKKLTQNQKDFADAMQKYLAEVMAAKGNEVTEALYDIDFYGNDKHYFPIKSSKVFLASKAKETAGDKAIKNAGFTNSLVPNANNPIILQGLTDVWADHVNQMSMYHAFVLPLEDFQRVYNYNTSASNEDASPEGVKSAIINAYGDAANSYIHQMLVDLNGGARVDPRAGLSNKLISAFKKGAVLSSASVVIQQPSAVVRAFAYIDPKYFAQTSLANLNLKAHSAEWEELKQYAPVAKIKEMGYFDTGMGMSTQGWIKETVPEGFANKAKALVTDSDYRDAVLSKAPELADQITWTHIWKAAKAQTLAENKDLTEGSAEHLEEAGRLFTETIVNTQVYDSVLSRSGMMRSKDGLVKMATSFMAEPTTSINMVVDAIIQAKRLGSGREARRIIASVLGQIILNAFLVSFVYAARDDDNDKTYVEKYMGQLAKNTLDNANPMTMIPYLKDVVSLMQGYDIERADMSVVADIIQAYRKLTNGDITFKKVEDFVAQTLKLFGVPLQNVIRDIRGIENVINGFMSDNTTTLEGIRESVLEEVTGKSANKIYGNDLSRAIKRGDTAKIKSVIDKWVKQKMKSGKTEKEAKSSIQSTLTTTYKPLFLKAYSKGDQAEMARIRRALNATGIYKDVVKTTQGWIKDSK